MRRLLLLLLLAPVTVFAQHGMNHGLASSGADARSRAELLGGPRTVRVLAVRAQFQVDTDTRSTGNGQFVLTAAATDTTLDAPPHDAAYFQNHLRFLAAYFQRVSKGLLTVQWTLLDSVITLPNPMVTYTPPRGSSNLPVANLARDTWRAVDSLHLVPDFHAYDCFLVFHAGAGRDIDLAGELGYDPAPYDIPSLSFGLNGLRALYGAGFQGFPVQGGAALITNTLILPETESRTLPGAIGDVPLELGINGMLCASLGSYLGLPDLFNTATGASGIGRFGLMDGESIFSFSGAFPPEPSAWEKYWLGWITPIELDHDRTGIPLPAVALADSIYRVSISSSEYFLIENRNRDPFRAGVTVTTVWNGQTRTQTFTRDVTGFSEYDIGGLRGVVTDVSVPDWSLPGGVSEDGTFYDGGALIWHIDEAAILRGMADNAVNTVAGHHGVRLLEADGSQDIGQSYGQFTGGSGSEKGTALDFWFSGNTSPVYKNALSGTTMPDSRSNGGSFSHVTVNAFSNRGPRMTFAIQRGDAAAVTSAGFPYRTGQLLSSLPLIAFGQGSYLLATRDSTVASATSAHPDRASHGTIHLASADSALHGDSGFRGGLIAQYGTGFSFGPGAAVLPGVTPGTVALRYNGPSGDALLLLALADVAPADGAPDEVARVPFSRRITCPPAVLDTMILVGTKNAMVYRVSFHGLVVDSLRVSPDTSVTVVGVSRDPRGGGALITLSDGSIALANPFAASALVTRRLTGTPAGPAVGIGATATQQPCIAVTTTDGTLQLLSLSLAPLTGFPVATGGSISAPPAVADVNGDGKLDLVVASGSRVCVYSLAGVSLDGYPVDLGAVRQITAPPVVGDLDGNGAQDVVVASVDGTVTALDSHGKPLAGFPVATGPGSHQLSIRSVTTGAPGIYLAATSSDDGGLTVWRTGTPSAAHAWPEYQHDASGSGVADAAPAGAAISSEFFPKARAYNWPNPVYTGSTFLRYYLGQDAVVHIKVFDLAGDLVKEMDGPGVGGQDNEVAWDVTGVQSGVYLARIEARGTGASEVRIVKVAVVR